MPRYALTVAALLAGSSVAHAVILEDFQFNDANGTELGAAANSINPGNLWQNSSAGSPIPGDLVNSTVQDGVFNVMKNDNFFSTRHLQIDNITSGIVYLVTEVASWNIIADASSLPLLPPLPCALPLLVSVQKPQPPKSPSSPATTTKSPTPALAVSGCAAALARSPPPLGPGSGCCRAWD